MNQDHETQMLIKFRSEGKKLAHLCRDWDFMAIHADCEEIIACCCDFDTEADNILRDEIVEKRNQQAIADFNSTSQDFSSVGAPAHSGTEETKLVVSEARLRTAVAQAREADIDLVTAIWSNLLMDCEKVK